MCFPYRLEKEVQAASAPPLTGGSASACPLVAAMGKRTPARQMLTAIRTRGTFGLPIFVHFPPAVEPSHLPYRLAGVVGDELECAVPVSHLPDALPPRRQPLSTAVASSWAARSR